MQNPALAKNHVTAIVLAAGESRRMGMLKPLLPYGKGTVLQAVVRSLIASPVAEILVILGHRSDEIAPTLADLPVRIVPNAHYREGMLSSVRAGVAAASAATQWFLVVIGDQPGIRSEVVRKLVAEGEAGGPGLLVPSFERRRGHPLLIHRRYRQEIESMSGQSGLRELFQLHPEELRYVLVDTDSVLTDMDTPEDYDREITALAEREQ